MPHKIRILFNVCADMDNVNAQSLNAREIALRLNPGMFECALFAQRPDFRFLGKSSIKFVFLPGRFKSFYKMFYFMFGNHDIIFYPPDYNLLKLYLCLRWLGKRKRIVMPLEGPFSYLKQKNFKAYYKVVEALKSSDFIVPVSELVKNELEQEVGIKAYGCLSVGVNTKFFTPVNRGIRKKVKVLFVGRLIKRKGVDLVIQAAKVFPEVEFQLVGFAYDLKDEEFVYSLKDEIGKCHLHNVSFLGKLAQEQVLSAMQESDIFLYPSRVDGLPKVTLEAAACGLPCVIFDDYKSVSVIDGITGYQVKTFEQMIEKLRLLIFDGALRLRLGNAALIHARKFDWDIIAQYWEQRLERIATSK